MEQQKRVYPAKRNHNRLASAVLLVASALIVASGLISRRDPSGFFLERVRPETPPPLEESFDETMTEALVELPANTWYALQVGAFENRETAMQSASAFQKRGAAGYLWQDGRYRVLAAAYPSQQDAQQVREQLRNQHDIDSYLYAIQFPAVSMRLTGMQGQIEILQAAFVHAGDLAAQLQALSVQMDRQEISAAEAVERLSALQTQIELVALRLRQRFDAPVHATVRALLNCFEDYSQFAAAFSADESAVAMGMKLKYQLFVTLQRIQDVYDTLNHT